jgi:TRAP-type mannitol/chloroaromatic compound transport system substrate-binding protein
MKREENPMSRLTKLTKGVAAVALLAATSLFGVSADAATKIRVQSVIPNTADEVVMLQDFAEDVKALTNGEVEFEILPVCLDPLLVRQAPGSSPVRFAAVAGGGIGMDNLAFVSWFQFGGGKELYDELWKEMGVNVKGFMLQPVGPEALGWFKEPIASMDDFRKYRFRTPPGIPGQAYKDIGVASVAMGGGDILPALEKGTIDAAEWCCPKPDSVFGFQKVLKHYYLQGLHQVVVNADMYINGDVYNSLTDHQKKALEVAANASLSKAMSYRIYENGKALKDLVDNQAFSCTTPRPTTSPAYMAAAKAAA